MTATRNQIYNALLALGTSVNSGLGVRDSGRRLKMWDQCNKPALFQTEPNEGYSSSSGRLRIRRLHVVWILYHDVGEDQNSIPQSETSNIMDALDALFPDEFNGERQTLGGLCHYVCIDGQVNKYEGDLDGQTIITVPLTILWP